MHRITPFLVASALALVPIPAFAHPAVNGVHDLLHGFYHPLGGIDHVLAMVAVGVLAAQLGGRALWLVPAAFVGVMAAAGVAGMAGLAIPYVEVGIALSLIVLGAVIALQISMPLAAAMALVGFFAIFHGHAHGTEMPATASGALYGLGFVSATALLHLVGIAMGIALLRLTNGRRVAQVAGSIAAVAGAALLIG